MIDDNKRTAKEISREMRTFANWSLRDGVWSRTEGAAVIAITRFTCRNAGRGVLTPRHLITVEWTDDVRIAPFPSYQLDQEILLENHQDNAAVRQAITMMDRIVDTLNSVEDPADEPITAPTETLLVPAGT